MYYMTYLFRILLVVQIRKQVLYCICLRSTHILLKNEPMLGFVTNGFEAQGSGGTRLLQHSKKEIGTKGLA